MLLGEFKTNFDPLMSSRNVDESPKPLVAAASVQLMPISRTAFYLKAMY